MKTISLWFLACTLLSPARGAEIVASSLAELQAAVNSAQSGDVVVLANGTYIDNSITVTTSNITVRAATPGGVFLNGTNAISIRGNNIVFSGFQFTSGSIPGIAIEVRGSGNTLAQLNFNGYSAQKYIAVKPGTQHNTISYSNFQSKPVTAPMGDLVQIDADPAVIGYHTISHNSFQHMPGRGGDNGNECIRLGEGAQSAFTSRTLVEYNYFEDTGAGDSEAMSVKSRGNVLRFNTMNKNPNAMMVFRNGDINIAYGNFFIDSGGIRVKESNNIYCYNNYFERAGIGGLGTAVTYNFISPNLRNINFLHNTFVDIGLIVFEEGATNNTWANNLFKKASGNIFRGSGLGIVWAGNLYTGTLGLTTNPSGMTSVSDLQLALNADDYYGLSSSSVAIDKGLLGLPAIEPSEGIDGDYSLALDIAGQFRDKSKDVGSVEYGATGPVTNRPLSLADVGPSYLQSHVGAVNAASHQEGTIARDSIVTLLGTGLAQRTESYDGTVVTTLGGATVKVIDSVGISRLAQMLLASETRIDFLLPAGTAVGPAVIVAKRADGGTPQNARATVALVAPGVFAAKNESSVAVGKYLRVTADGQHIKDHLFDPDRLEPVTIPRASGDRTYLLLHGTGFRHAVEVTATVNGQTVPVVRDASPGPFPGRDHLKLGPLPEDLPSGTMTIRLVAEGQQANAVTVVVQ